MSMHVMRSVYKVKIIIEVNICIYFIHVCLGSMDNVDDIHLSFFIKCYKLLDCL